LRRSLVNPPVLLASIIVALAALQSCSDSTAPNWSSEGIQAVFIDSMVAPDTSSEQDTLRLALWSAPVQGDRFDSLHFNVVRDIDRVDLTITVHVYRWIGSRHMPPTNKTPLHGDPYKIAPPFQIGSFVIAVQQPDASALIYTVTIVP
jgi:hypothetical protein